MLFQLADCRLVAERCPRRFRGEPLQDPAVLGCPEAASELHLPTALAEAERLAEIAVRERQTHRGYLAELLAAEVDDRSERRRVRRINEAKFPASNPEFRNCTAPSTERILEIFATVARHQLHRDDALVQTFEPELTTQQLQVLELLGLPRTVYTQHP